MHKPLTRLDFPGFYIHEYKHGFQSYIDKENPLVLSGNLGDCKRWTEEILSGKWET